MSTKLTVNVTQKHIDEGVQEEGSSCMVSKALYDTLDAKGIEIDTDYGGVTLNYDWTDSIEVPLNEEVGRKSASSMRTRRR